MISSEPGPLTGPKAITLSRWNGVGKEGRLDIVLTAQKFGYASVVNTWDEIPGDWGEICRVVHNPSL